MQGHLQGEAGGGLVLIRADGASQAVKNEHLSDPLKAEVDKLRTQKKAFRLLVDFDLSGGQPVNIRKSPDAPPPTPEPARGHQPHQSRGPRRGPAAPAAAPARVTNGFHNPYNFVPAPSREKLGAEHPLGDGAPCGHHRYEAERITGWIDVALETVTPLLLPDAARGEVGGRKRDHKMFPIRRGPDGRPYVAPTAVKGMLSAAYEAVTNSRLRVFRKHQDRIGKRMRTQEGLRLVRARVEGNTLRLLTGTASINRDGSPNGPVYGAWLPAYRPVVALPPHRQEVTCWVERIQHWRWDRRRNEHAPDFQYWRVRQHCPAGRTESLNPSPPPPSPSQRQQGRSHHESLGEFKRIRGWVCVTNQNIDNKHDERVFFEGATPIVLPLDEEHRKQWRELIADYQNIHDEELKRGRTGPPALRNSKWSRHVEAGRARPPQERELDEGDLCYVRLDPRGSSWEVAGLFPVNISRELFARPPQDLLDASLRPARRLSEFSPADRVFGWVSQDDDESRGRTAAGRRKADVEVAYRGQLRIGPVECRTSDAIADFRGEGGVPLAILSAPKPSQAGFYVADASGRPVARKNDGYAANQRLRGRKVYPHHRAVAGAEHEAYWQDPHGDRTQQGEAAARHGGAHQEYRRPDGPDVRDDQNRTMLEWVRIGAEFRFRIHVTNLSQVELGALLWLLDLPEGCFHRLGGGKPLGFGSVRLSVVDSDLRSGSDWSRHYQAGLIEAADTVSADHSNARRTAVSAFEKAVVGGYGNGKAVKLDGVGHIEAFLAGCRGFENGSIHYPRTSSAPDAKGENFKWFGTDGRFLPLLRANPDLLPYT